MPLTVEEVGEVFLAFMVIYTLLIASFPLATEFQVGIFCGADY